MVSDHDLGTPPGAFAKSKVVKAFNHIHAAQKRPPSEADVRQQMMLLKLIDLSRMWKYPIDSLQPAGCSMGSLLGTLPSDGLLWRLQGSTPKLVDGHVRPSGNGGWLVLVVQNCEAVLSESYPDAAEALTRAGQIRDGLVAKGWSQVPVGPDTSDGG